MLNYNRILDILILKIIPQTFKNVEKGNKIFGGAILDKKDLSIITIGLNDEITNPLLHGEISTINNFFDINNNLDPKNYIFLTTHEPCSLCLSAITWAGFNNFYYFFSYLDTKDKFSIPHDLKIMSEVFKIDQGKYTVHNSFWKSFSIKDEVSKLSIERKEKLQSKIDKINKEYEILSFKYQQNKDQNKIPLN